MQKENKGWEMERAQLQNFYHNRERKLKEQYLFQIEAMETAIHEIKIKAN